MPHIHELIDFTIGAFIVYKKRVLFIHHKQLNKWLPIGGHIELDEDPEQALFREIEEEAGLTKKDITILSIKPNYESLQQKYLYTPNLMDIHQINDTHRHIGIFYFVKASTDKITLAEEEHNHIKWLSQADLHDPKFAIHENIVYAAEHAIKAANGY